MRAGSAVILPLVVGALPFALISGFATVDIGLGLGEAVGFSFFLFAGASQLAAVELLRADAPILMTVLTVVVVNLRLAMYSASLSSYVSGAPRYRRLVGAYMLTDQAYAVSVSQFSRVGAVPVDPWWYYFGAALPIWSMWQLFTFLGALLGDQMPEGAPLGFAVPLAFLALLLPAIGDRPTLLAGLSAATVATAGANLPANAGMLLGAFAGIGVGLAVSFWSRRAGVR